MRRCKNVHQLKMLVYHAYFMIECIFRRSYDDFFAVNKYLPVIDKQPVAGANIHTTIDVNLQDFCENALVEKLKEIDGMYGVAILMEVKTGDTLP